MTESIWAAGQGEPIRVEPDEAERASAFVKNVALARRVMDRVDREAARGAWTQRTWGDTSKDSECGTRACFAGWTLIESGWRTKPGHMGNVVYIDPETNGSADCGYSAADLLGLTSAEAGRLFEASSDIVDLQEMRELMEDVMSG